MGIDEDKGIYFLSPSALRDHPEAADDVARLLTRLDQALDHPQGRELLRATFREGVRKAFVYSRNFGELVDLYERKPDLFRILRGLIDGRKRAGGKAGHFLLLGSDSRDLLQQSSESLAGRIRYLELTPFSAAELYRDDPEAFDVETLWLRGGFPDSYLAENDDESWRWRDDFISSYVERDIPLMGPHVPAARMKRFWSMLSHYHGSHANLSEIGKSLEVSHTTIRTYMDILTDFYMVRQVPPWSGSTKKRLVKSPKIYLRDTGLLHKLLNISDIESLLGHPVVGASWEGFIVENIVSRLSKKWQYSYYRTASHTEIDLVLEGPGRQRWAIEIRRSAAPKLTGEFHQACKDIKATRKFVLHSGPDRFPMAENTEATNLTGFLKHIQEFDPS